MESAIKVALIAAGLLLIVLGGLAALFVFVMFTHPGGIGAERLLGPILGFAAILLFTAGGWLLRIAARIHADAARPPGALMSTAAPVLPAVRPPIYS